MTADQALEGVRELSRHFGRPYKGADLNAVWVELLQQPHAAFTRAVGELKMIRTVLPDFDVVLSSTKKWVGKLEQELTAGDEQGVEACSYFTALIGGKITELEYIAAMYRMSEKYGNPMYAEIAREREQKG